MEIELVTLQDLENLKKEILIEMKKMLDGHKSKQEKRWLKSNDVQKLLGISPDTLQPNRGTEIDQGSFRILIWVSQRGSQEKNLFMGK